MSKNNFTILTFHQFKSLIVFILLTAGLPACDGGGAGGVNETEVLGDSEEAGSGGGNGIGSESNSINYSYIDEYGRTHKVTTSVTTIRQHDDSKTYYRLWDYLHSSSNVERTVTYNQLVKTPTGYLPEGTDIDNRTQNSSQLTYDYSDRATVKSPNSRKLIRYDLNFSEWELDSITYYNIDSQQFEGEKLVGEIIKYEDEALSFCPSGTPMGEIYRTAAYQGIIQTNDQDHTLTKSTGPFYTCTNNEELDVVSESVYGELESERTLVAHHDSVTVDGMTYADVLEFKEVVEVRTPPDVLINSTISEYFQWSAGLVATVSYSCLGDADDATSEDGEQVCQEIITTANVPTIPVN